MNEDQKNKLHFASNVPEDQPGETDQVDICVPFIHEDPNVMWGYIEKYKKEKEVIHFHISSSAILIPIVSKINLQSGQMQAKVMFTGLVVYKGTKEERDRLDAQLLLQG